MKKSNSFKALESIKMSPKQQSVSETKHEMVKNNTIGIIEKLKDAIMCPNSSIKKDNHFKDKRAAHPSEILHNFNRYQECQT